MRYVLLINIDKTAPTPQDAEIEAILQGQPCPPQSRPAASDRRPLPGDEGGSRRLLRDRVRHAGRSDRVGQEDPAPRRPQRRSLAALAQVDARAVARSAALHPVRKLGASVGLGGANLVAGDALD